MMTSSLSNSNKKAKINHNTELKPQSCSSLGTVGMSWTFKSAKDMID